MRSTWRVLALGLLVGCDPKEPDETNPQLEPPTAGETTEPQPPTVPPGCVAATIGAAGGTLEAEGVRVEILPDALDDGSELLLCPAEAPSGFELYSSVWELSGAEPSKPVQITLSHQGDSDLALFVPWRDGQPARCIEQDAGQAGQITGPMYRPGIFFAAADPRLQAPWQAVGAADLLFVVDHSPTMLDSHQRLLDAFPQILDALLARAVDYHVGVISVDLDDPAHDGKLREVQGVRWLEPGTPDPAAVFEGMVLMGMGASPVEQGIGAAYKALAVHSQDYNAGFQREGTELSLVVLTDEPDYTDPALITQTAFADYLLGLEASGLPDVSFHSLVRTNGVEVGMSYLDTTTAVGGYSLDLHDPGWESFFEDVLGDLGEDFVLSPAASATPEAWVVPASGEEPFPLAPDTVSFDPATQVVRVWSPLVEQGDLIWLLYPPQ